MLILPATADVDRGVHRRCGGRPRRALDDRQRHALPADAVRAGGGARQARGVRADGLRRATPTAQSARWRRSAALATPVVDMVQPDALSGDLPARGRRRTARSPSPGRCSSTASTRAVAETILEHLEASDAAMRAAQLRVLGGAMARVPADATAFAHRRAGSWSTSPRSTRPGGPRRARGVGRGPLAALHQDDDGAYVNFLGRRGRGTDPDGLPGRDVGPARAVKAPLRPGQPVPAQPEHPASVRRRV